ncbi:hypothetical protein PMI01_01395 [Caulobacter sp. AP07]|uniref:hypothetical protein n=1 Tax=Caulobacter sp. AP07 TaxID=1144304 RepID=UPI000272068A|nr:hypothetical protein [Caulobacter sp. AP07]EJL34702.1 hypothetical protein PMI01_01395 [Caulobacter sp. AP07]
MGDRPSTAVLGFRPHTYWTAVVALAGPFDAPRVVARRRVVFAAGRERFVYHQAATLEPARAHALIAEVHAATQANAAREIGDLVADLRRDGVEVRVAVAPTGTAKLPQDLEDILRVHARIHAAEGEFYREVVASACAGLGLEVRRVVERDLPARLGQALRIDGATLEARLKALGAALGPPWNADYRLATQAAWLHLGAP